MEWTKGLPEEKGIYWYIDKEETEPSIMYVTKDITGKLYYDIDDFVISFTVSMLNELDPKYYGPITPPEIEGD